MLPVGWAGRGESCPTCPAVRQQPCHRSACGSQSKCFLASSLPACSASCAALCGVTSLQSMLEEEGSPLLTTLLVKKNGINEQAAETLVRSPMVPAILQHIHVATSLHMGTARYAVYPEHGMRC